MVDVEDASSWEHGMCFLMNNDNASGFMNHPASRICALGPLACPCCDPTPRPKQTSGGQGALEFLLELFSFTHFMFPFCYHH